MINKLKSYLTLGFLLSVYTGYGQVIKTYTGDFEEGNATYQYYEDNQFNRIFHKNFFYQSKLWDLKGEYLNGKKNNNWLITALNKKAIGWGTILLNTKISGNFKNGELNGLWYFSNAVRYVNEEKKDDDIIISKAQFNNGVFCGDYEFSLSIPVHSIKVDITGQFDSTGLKKDVWKYSSGKIKGETRYKNGIAYWALSNNIENGAKLTYFDSTNFTNQFLKLYNKKEGWAEINGKFYFADTINCTEGRFDDIYNIWNAEYITIHNSVAFTNPLYYYQNGQNPPRGFQIVIKECRQYSKCYEKLKLKEELALQQVKDSAKYYFNNEQYELAILKYKKILELDRLNGYVAGEIRIAESKLEEQEKQRAKYNTHIFYGDIAMKQNRYEAAITEYSNAIKLFNKEKYPKEQLEKAKALQQLEEKMKAEMEKQKFLQDRKISIFSIDEVNPSAKENIENLISNLVINHFKLNRKKSIDYLGNINVFIDTLGKSKIEIIDTALSKDNLPKELRTKIISLNLNPTEYKGYLVNSNTTIVLDIKSSSGKDKIAFSGNGVKGEENTPVEIIKYLSNKYSGKLFGVNKINYFYISTMDEIYAEDEIEQ